VSRLEAIACPLVRDQIDTDAFIPVSENTRLTDTGYGDALFAAWRYTDIAARLPNPEFVLNRAPFDRAQILICGRNVGCGSSRESAVWALRDYGFRVVLAISFNETFLRNCVANRIWPLQIAEADATALVAEVASDPERTIAVDLADRSVVARRRYPVEADPYYLHLLAEGLSEDELLERYEREIAAVVRRQSS
jgi:3-isopropylmalate/(R)-2-methylmalate dehydratase small subunit